MQRCFLKKSLQIYVCCLWSCCLLMLIYIINACDQVYCSLGLWRNTTSVPATATVMNNQKKNLSKMTAASCHSSSCFSSAILSSIMLTILLSLCKTRSSLPDLGATCWEVFSKGPFAFGFTDVELKWEDANLTLPYRCGAHMLGELVDPTIRPNTWKTKNRIGSDMDMWLAVLK